jgi:outer membrane protein assembly factor BamB
MQVPDTIHISKLLNEKNNMNYAKTIAFASILIWLIGCKTPMPTKVDPEPTASAVVWKFERSKKGFYTNSIVHDDLIIMGMQSDEDPNPGFSLIALTIDSGKLVWQNDDFIRKFNPFGTEDVAYKDGIIVLSRASHTYALNAKTGEMLWSDVLEYGDYNIAIIDNWVYKNTYYQRKSSTLFRYDLRTGKKEHVLTIDIDKDKYGSGYTPTLFMPLKWEHPSGDEVLILQNRTFGWNSTMESKMDILAYNVTADTMLWYIDGIDNTSCSAKPILDEDRVFFLGSYFVHCIDPLNGNTLWRFKSEDPTGDFNTTNLLISNDVLVVKPESRWMYGVNKATGKKLWLNKNTRGEPHLLQEHNGSVWFGSNGIQGVKAANGRHFVNWKGNSSGWWSAPVTPHPENETIFTTDGEFIYCINPNRLPPPEE